MALVTCPECNNIVSDKAEICPSCGFKLQENTAFQSTYNTTNSGKLLFSTKSLYDSFYVKDRVVYYVVALAIAIFAFRINFLFGLVFLAVYLILFQKPLQKSSFLKQSYIELYENIISGRFADEKNSNPNETIFSINYLEITHIDDVANQEIVIHTPQGDYRAQAFRCADKVKNIIQQQMQNA